MSKRELHLTLHGGKQFMGIRSGGVKGYNSTMLSQGMPWRCTTMSVLRQWLRRSGYSEKLADGVGYTPPESPFLAKLAESVN